MCLLALGLQQQGEMLITAYRRPHWHTRVECERKVSSLLRLLLCDGEYRENPARLAVVIIKKSGLENEAEEDAESEESQINPKLGKGEISTNTMQASNSMTRGK